MAVDPKETLRDLEENLKDIENSGLNIVATLGGQLKDALLNNIALAQSLVEKFKVNLARVFDKSQQERILVFSMDYKKLSETSVNDYLDLYVKANYQSNV